MKESAGTAGGVWKVCGSKKRKGMKKCGQFPEIRLPETGGVSVTLAELETKYRRRKIKGSLNRSIIEIREEKSWKMPEEETKISLVIGNREGGEARRAELL